MPKEELPTKVNPREESRNPEDAEKIKHLAALRQIIHAGFIRTHVPKFPESIDLDKAESVWDLAEKQKDGVLELKSRINTYLNAIEKSRNKNIKDMNKEEYEALTSINYLASLVGSLVGKWANKKS